MELANWKNTWSKMSGQVNWHIFVIFWEAYSSSAVLFLMLLSLIIIFLWAFMGCFFFHKHSIILFFHPLCNISYFWTVDPNFELMKFCIWSTSNNAKTCSRLYNLLQVLVFILINVVAIVYGFVYCHYFVVSLVAKN